ncbi:MAG: hypothetical protein RL297_816 [Pseudomonadota bacterium]
MSDDSSRSGPGLGRDCLFEDRTPSRCPTAAPTTIDPPPQALVRYGYKRCTRRTYFIRLSSHPTPSGRFVDDGHVSLRDCTPNELLTALKNVRDWVEKHQEKHSQNGPSVPFLSLDMAWTFSGLEALGLDPRLLRVFRRKSPAFAEGAWLRAAQHAGDTGPSDVKHWHAAYQAGQGDGVDLILVAHFAAAATSEGSPITADTGLVTSFEAELWRQLWRTPPHGFSLSSPMPAPWIEDSHPRDWAGTVHFGYKDGITRPQFSAAGLQDQHTPFEKHAWGELLLGHPKNQNDNPYGHLDLPPAAISPDGLKWTGLSRKEEQELHFFKNSSFAVFRKMQQKEDVFDAWVQQQAVKLCPNPADLDQWVIWVKAKVMGRMPVVSGHLYPHALPAGTRLTPEMKPEHLLDMRRASPSADPSPLGHEGGFRHPSKPMTDDPLGLGCPFASHIRRMNPKDDPVVPFTARPLLRRGMTYQEGTTPSEVGLSGLFICADIETQFEHLVGRWANHRVMGVVDGSNCRDPIIGQHQDDGLHFTIEGKAGASKLKLGELAEPFVITRGCVYAWFPSKQTLDDLPRFLRNPKNLKPSGGGRLA